MVGCERLSSRSLPFVLRVRVCRLPRFIPFVGFAIAHTSAGTAADRTWCSARGPSADADSLHHGPRGGTTAGACEEGVKKSNRRLFVPVHPTVSPAAESPPLGPRPLLTWLLTVNSRPTTPVRALHYPGMCAARLCAFTARGPSGPAHGWWGLTEPAHALLAARQEDVLRVVRRRQRHGRGPDKQGRRRRQQWPCSHVPNSFFFRFCPKFGSLREALYPWPAQSNIDRSRPGRPSAPLRARARPRGVTRAFGPRRRRPRPPHPPQRARGGRRRRPRRAAP